MDGIINILKPPGMTSFDVIGFLRRLLKTKKIGHCGTLDPGATGVLTVCVGRATKVIEYLMGNDKIYRVELILGVSTDTQDSFGRVLSTKEVSVSDDRIKNVMQSFVGRYMQTPPMYSAIKVGGKKLYELARKGEIVERKPREININYIDVLRIKENSIIFDVSCSKGTYIRTLCSDIGDVLGFGGHMSFLVRLRSGDFDISESFLIEEIKELSENDQFSKVLLKVDEALKEFKKVFIDEENEKKFVNGCKIGVEGIFIEKEKVRIYNIKEEFLGIGEITCISPKVVLKADKIFI